MQKKIDKFLEKCIFKTTVGSLHDINRNDNCYMFGYIDGYFGENIYGSFIDNIDECMPYNDGLEDGIKDKNRVVEKDLITYKTTKLRWIEQLALHDLLNGERERPFKTDEDNSRSYKLFQIYKNCAVVKGTSFSLNRSDSYYVKKYISDRRVR